MTSRLANGGYGVSDAIGDAVRLGWHWGLDWARVSTNVLEFVTAMGQEAQPERGAPGLRGLRPIEHMVWPLDGRDPPVEAADLRGISPGGAVLGRNRIRVIPATVGRDPAVRVLVDTSRVPYGMYVGKFKVSGDDVPFQFYVSRTAPVPS